MLFNAMAMLLLKQVTYKVLTVTEIHVPPIGWVWQKQDQQVDRYNLQ